HVAALEAPATRSAAAAMVARIIRAALPNTKPAACLPDTALAARHSHGTDVESHTGTLGSIPTHSGSGTSQFAKHGHGYTSADAASRPSDAHHAGNSPAAKPARGAPDSHMSAPGRCDLSSCVYPRATACDA